MKNNSNPAELTDQELTKALVEKIACETNKTWNAIMAQGKVPQFCAKSPSGEPPIEYVGKNFAYEVFRRLSLIQFILLNFEELSKEHGEKELLSGMLHIAITGTPEAPDE